MEVEREKIKIHSSVLAQESELLDNIFRMYIEDINPFVVRFEVSSGEFPAEVQNEIRAIYGHLIRASMAESPEKVRSNIEKMKSHSKRALLDCFKYTSILCSDNYDDFMKRYENIDLTFLDDGEFLRDVVLRCKRARKALQNAKIAETTNILEDELFSLYQDAYLQFEELNDKIEKAEKSAAYLQRKATKNRAAESEANLVLMGIEPTYPSEKYGYIIPKSKENISEVSMFKEKPTAEVAEGYISQGALWNGGVFAFRLGYVLKRAHELIDFKNYDDLFAKYNTLKKISFDYAVVEHEPLIEVMRFSGTWKDLGTWNTLTEAMDSNNVGEALFNEKCENVHVVNELNMPVLCMGLKDVVVSASPEGILVSDKEQSSYIKPFVETFNKQVMFAEKSWGSFRVLDVEKESLTIKVTLNPGHKMNYHSHTNRDEVWTVVSGTGYTIIDGQKQIVRPGDILRMPAGCKHTIVADTELQVIEVQMGKDISVHDKEKFELEI